MAVWKDKFIAPNKFSRPTTRLTAVRKIVMHYTANNGATAMNHFNYFNNLKNTYASAHLFVDKQEALCIIPLNEISYHANDIQQRDAKGNPYRGVAELRPNANFLSVGIELCMEKDGSFHPNTLSRAEDVAVELCKRYKLDPQKDIIRHYDVTRKRCPAPWISAPSNFTKFKSNVQAKLKGGAVSANQPAGRPLLYDGTTGDAVKELQSLLNAKGYKLVVDGIFGKATDTAVRAYQKSKGLKVDGYVGDVTWRNLTYVAPKPVPKPTPAPKPVVPTEKPKAPTPDGGMKLELSNGQWDMLFEAIQEARKDGYLHEDSWEKKAKNKSLTLSEAVFLSIILDQRRGNNFSTKK